MSELKAHHIIGLDGRCNSVDNDFYIKSEADKVIERIIKGAMSMFRESNRCRGLDTKSPLGRIADVAFKHWMYVERMESRITEKDKEIAELKEFIENYRFDNKNMLHKIMNQDKKIRMLKRALWLARAERASDKANIFYFAMTCGIRLNIDGFSNKEKGRTRMHTAKYWRITWLKVERKCRAKAEEYK